MTPREPYKLLDLFSGIGGFSLDAVLAKATGE